MYKGQLVFTQLMETLREHRGLSSGGAGEALSHGSGGQCRPQYAGRGQGEARLAHLRRIRPESDRRRASALGRRSSGLELKETVYALESTTIDLCLSVFPWAQLGRDRGVLMLHTLLDLQENVPAKLWIFTTASFADVRLLHVLLPAPGSIYILDRSYLDFAGSLTSIGGGASS